MLRRIVQVVTFFVLTLAAFVAGVAWIPALVASGYIFLVGWVASGIWIMVISRRYIKRSDATRSAHIHAVRATTLLIAGGCAHPWCDNTGAHLCVRPYEHRGPHACGYCVEAVDR